MKKKTIIESEIVSFNEEVPGLPSLIELDDMDLESVAGGWCIGDCGTNCGTNCGANAPREVEQL